MGSEMCIRDREIPLSLFCRVKNSRSGDIFAAGVMIDLGIAVLVAIGVGVLITLGIAVLVGTGIAVLGTSITEEVVAPELVESTDWGEVVGISCVQAANTERENVVININFNIIS